MASRIKPLVKESPSYYSVMREMLRKDISQMEERISLTLGKALGKVLDERLDGDALNEAKRKYMEEVEGRVKELVNQKFQEVIDTVKMIQVTLAPRPVTKHISYDEYGRPVHITERDS